MFKNNKFVGWSWAARGRVLEPCTVAARSSAADDAPGCSPPWWPPSRHCGCRCPGRCRRRIRILSSSPPCSCRSAPRGIATIAVAPLSHFNFRLRFRSFPFLCVFVFRSERGSMKIDVWKDSKVVGFFDPLFLCLKKEWYSDALIEREVSYSFNYLMIEREISYSFNYFLLCLSSIFL